MPSSLKTLTMRIHAWLTQDAGQALTEYALILALIALVTVTALALLSGSVTHPLSSVGSSIQN